MLTGALIIQLLPKISSQYLSLLEILGEAYARITT